jgi:hypothetical protein
MGLFFKMFIINLLGSDRTVLKESLEEFDGDNSNYDKENVNGPIRPCNIAKEEINWDILSTR